MVAVGDLSGSGGAERYFAQLFEYLREQRSARTQFITAASSLRRLQSAGRLVDSDEVIALPLGEAPAATKVGIARTTFHLLRTVLQHRFDVVHICLPTPTYVPFAAVITRLPHSDRPRVTLNVIDCTVAVNLEGRTTADLYERQVLAAHYMYARWPQLDGVFSWYRAFVEVARAKALFPTRTKLTAARYCFTDPSRFTAAPTKDNIAVFAGRLSEQKRPLLFVDAVAQLRSNHPELVRGWRFEMYGRGELEERVRGRIAALGLGNLVTITHAIDMAPVFARSRVFVSTQAIENFTSLAMLEAMAAGNAVIAANVGQTGDFVRHGANGLLVDAETPDGFAAALADYLRTPERHDAMAAESCALVLSVHTVQNAAADIIAFWRDVLEGAN